jgi:multiple sugar transport system permease protein
MNTTVENITSQKPARGASRWAFSLSPRRRSQYFYGYLFILPWLLGFLIFTIVPIGSSFYLAFTNYDIMSAPKWIGLANFERMFTMDTRYWASVKATLYYVMTAVPLRLVFALLVAMILNNDRKGIGIYRALFYAPSIVGGSVAVAVMWRQVFGKEGLVNYLLAFLGVVPVAWLGNPRTAIWTLILMAAWQFGSPMLIFLAGLRQIPSSLYEAASMDGADGPSKFFNITLPMLSPVIFFNLLMQTIGGFMVLTQALIVTNGGPLNTTLFYALYLYQRAFQSLHMGYGSAMAWVLLAVVAVITALLFKSSTRWVFYETKEGL